MLLGDDPTDEAFSTEYFGPILSVHVYDDADRAPAPTSSTLVDQGSAYGLTGAVIADDRTGHRRGRPALRFAAGNFYVNDKPTGAVVGQQPFGGARASGTNDKAGSAQNLLRWTSARTIKETFVPPGPPLPPPGDRMMNLSCSHSELAPPGPAGGRPLGRMERTLSGSRSPVSSSPVRPRRDRGRRDGCGRAPALFGPSVIWSTTSARTSATPTSREATVNAYLSLLDALGSRSESASTARPLEVSIKLSALGQSLPRRRGARAGQRPDDLWRRAAGRRLGERRRRGPHHHRLHAVDRARAAQGVPDGWGRCCRPTCTAPRPTAASWPARARGSGCARAPTTSPPRWPSRAGDDVDASYLRCLRVLMDGEGYPMVASHDPQMIAAAPGVRPRGRPRASTTSRSRCSTASATPSSPGWSTRAFTCASTSRSARLVRLLHAPAGRAPRQPDVLPALAGRAQALVDTQSALVDHRERMVFMGNDPAAVALMQANRHP